MKKIIFLLYILAFSSLSLFADAVDADKLIFKVKKMAFYTSANCEGEHEIFEITSPKSQDFLGKDLNLGSKEVNVGVYKCIVFEISDQVTYSPKDNTEDGVCEKDKDYDIDVCDSESIQKGEEVYLIGGTKVTCTDGEDTVPIYMSTEGSANGFAFGPPAQIFDQDGEKVNGGMFLETPMTVDTTNIIGTLKTLTTDKVLVEDGKCVMDQPTFTFTTTDS